MGVKGLKLIYRNIIHWLFSYFIKKYFRKVTILVDHIEMTKCSAFASLREGSHSSHFRFIFSASPDSLSFIKELT